MKSKLNNYNLAKGSLVQMQRKKTLVRVFLDIYAASQLSMLQRKSVCSFTSRYRTGGALYPRFGISTNCPCCGSKVSVTPSHLFLTGARNTFKAHLRNSVKDWNSKYERLTPMIVPRSSSYVFACQHSQVLSKDDTGLSHRTMSTPYLQ